MDLNHLVSRRRELKDSTLIGEGSFINGSFTSSRFVDSSFPIVNPANGSVVRTLAEVSDAEVDSALKSAEVAFAKWRNSTQNDRDTFLRNWRAQIEMHLDDLATLLTLENGKPLKESRGEIGFARIFIDWNIFSASRAYGTSAVQPSSQVTAFVTKQPVGVCLLITSWNFPVAMLTRKVAMAIAAGCVVLVKPSELAPLSSLALAELARRAGAPPGLFNVLATTRAVDVVGKAVNSRCVRLVSFTGSMPVGRLVAASAANRVLRTILELGGHAPFIVFNDADVDAAVEGLMSNKFRNTGQACIAANRVFVQRGAIYEEFCDRLHSRMGKLVVGDGFDENVDVGPLINESAVRRVSSHVEDAISSGARLVCGGVPKKTGRSIDNFFPPTLLVDVVDDMKISCEETFGPVVAVLGFDEECEVLSRANDMTDSGMAAFVYTKDGGRAMRASRELQFSMVGVNDVNISGAATPFGGMRQSGLGREGGAGVLDAFTEEQYRLFRF